MRQCANAPMRQCANAPMRQCANAPDSGLDPDLPRSWRELTCQDSSPDWPTLLSVVLKPGFGATMMPPRRFSRVQWLHLVSD